MVQGIKGQYQNIFQISQKQNITNPNLWVLIVTSNPKATIKQPSWILDSKNVYKKSAKNYNVLFRSNISKCSIKKIISAYIRDLGTFFSITPNNICLQLYYLQMIWKWDKSFPKFYMLESGKFQENLNYFSLNPYFICMTTFQSRETIDILRPWGNFTCISVILDIGLHAFLSFCPPDVCRFPKSGFASL